MKYTPRGYQYKVVDMTMEFLEKTKHKNGINILPTGAGKSIIIAELARRLKEPLIIFQPSREILEQNYLKYCSYGFTNASIYSASFNSKEISDVTFATIGSTYRKPELFSHFKIAIIDECDVVNPKQGMYKEFLETIKCRIIGFTATPFRLAHNSWGTIIRFLTRTRPRVFHDVIAFVQIGDLMNQGYLHKPEYVRIAGFDSSRLEVNSTGNDYKESSVRKYFDEIEFQKSVLNTSMRCIETRKHTLIFTQFLKEALYLQKESKGKIGVVSANTLSKERRDLTAAFKEGHLKGMANVGIYQIGFDFPELDTIIGARPTRSLRLYYQMIGRMIRTSKDKHKAYYIDLVQNMLQFGRIEDYKITKDEKGLWCLNSGDKQLTNVYF